MMTPGTLLGGRYRIEAFVASGGMGHVYRARDIRAQRVVALKICQDAVEREARILAGLSHRNIVAVLDVFSEDGTQVLVMEMIEGRSLQQRLDEEGPLRSDEILAYASAICDALEYLHAQDPPIVFRDLKPANLIVDEHGALRMVDFGIAHPVVPRTTTLLRGIGTDGFAPLEQYVGGTDARSDIYALGATLYALRVGQPPPPSPSRALGAPLPAVPDVPPHVAAAIRVMLSLRREDRPATIGQVRAALAQSAARDVLATVHAVPVVAAVGPGYAHPSTEVFRGVLPLAEQALDRIRAAGLRGRLVFSRDAANAWPGQWTVQVCHAP